MSLSFCYLRYCQINKFFIKLGDKLLEDLQPPIRATECLVSRLAAGLDDKDKIIFIDAIDSETKWSASGLSTALRKKDLWIADVTITRHRRKTCGCYAR